MRYEAREITLRDGRTALLRSPEEADAAALLEHRILTSGETPFMARYPDELTSTVEEQRAHIERLTTSPSSCNVCAFVSGELAASAGFDPVVPGLYRYGHRADFGISVKEKYWRLGLGRALTSACIETARAAGCEQLELTASAENAHALALYEDLGFVKLCVRPQGFRYRDGTYADEVLMTLKLK